MRPGKKTRPRGGDNSYRTSNTDKMAGMLFVFALILFAAVYQLVDLQQKKTNELQTKEAQLSTLPCRLFDQEAELKDKEELLAATTLALQQQQEELDQNRTALASAHDSLALQQIKIENQAAQLAAYYAETGGGQNIPVDVTAVKQVKKIPNGKPGMVIYHTYRTVIANPYPDIVVDAQNAETKE